MPHRYQQIQEKIAAWRRTGYPVKGYPGLVFAPVLTILASLREPSEALYSQILPPCLYRRLEAICRLFFTQEGEKDLAVVRGSRYNLVVTNTKDSHPEAGAPAPHLDPAPIRTDRPPMPTNSTRRRPESM